jgi:putative exporter of polyketide antibiotics
MAETITVDGITYQIPVDMHEFEQKAIVLDRRELIDYAVAEWGMEPRLTNLAWIALQIGEFDFTLEDILIYLIEEFEHLDEWRTIYDDEY